MTPDLIISSISPAVLISSIALLILSMTNRINTIGSRIRQLNILSLKIIDGLEKENVTKQLQYLLKRGRMIRNCLFTLSSAICCMVLTMLILALSHIKAVSIPSYISVIPFMFSLILVFIATLIGIAETSLNIKALELDITLFNELSPVEII